MADRYETYLHWVGNTPTHVIRNLETGRSHPISDQLHFWYTDHDIAPERIGQLLDQDFSEDKIIDYINLLDQGVPTGWADTWTDGS